MGEHVNTKKDTQKHHKRGFAEGQDIRLQRARRVTFKNYIQQLEDDLLEQELEEDAEEWVVERGVKDHGDTVWVLLETFTNEQDAEDCADEYRDNEPAGGDEYRISKV